MEILYTNEFIWRNGALMQKLLTLKGGTELGSEWEPVKVGNQPIRDPKFKTFEDRNGKEPATHRNGWDHVIEFDGGTSCNSPKKGFGNGYGSYRIDDRDIVKVTFGKGHSNNSAEIRTLVAALNDLASGPHGQTVMARGDSQIALKWIKCPLEPKKSGSEGFLEAVGLLREAIKPFQKVKGEWRRRTHSVALFGH